MPLKRYDPETKAAFIKAASAARAAKKPWAEAFTAATDAGYKGTVGGIKQAMLPKKSKGKKPGRPKKAAPVAGKRGPGRPRTSEAVAVAPKKRGRPRKIAVSLNGLAGIEAVIDGTVRERVSAAIGKAIEALEAAR